MSENSSESEGIDEIDKQVEAFLRRELPAAWIVAIEAGDANGLMRAHDELNLGQWWVNLASAGYVCPTWPKEYGGLGLGSADGAAVGRTLTRFKVPRFTNPVGVDLVGPAILQWGTEEQKDRFLRPIARHEEIWCQLFSEPGSGSDLAGLSTRALKDGDTWQIQGQKVWTSLAHVASHGLLLARTDPTMPKHKGITAFLLPMHQVGVTVRPLRHMAGDIEFNEVFLDDALVDDRFRLGGVGEGWHVARSVLSNERQASSGSGGALPGTVTGRSVEALIRRHSPVADPHLRQRLARAYIEDRILQFTARRSGVRRKSGLGAGPEGSVMKLMYSEQAQRLQELACDLEGPGGQAWSEDDRWRKNTAWSFVRVRSKTIAGGTSEIQRNVIGEHALGLPREPDVDRELPWSSTRHS